MLKALSAPFRKFFNQRFESIKGEIQAVQRQLEQVRAEIADGPASIGQRTPAGAVPRSVSELSAAMDDRQVEVLTAASLLGRSIDAVGEGLDILLDRTDPAGPDFIGPALVPAPPSDAVVTLPAAFDPVTRGSVAQLTDQDATVANYAESHLGWASQAGYWFNPPISLAYAAGGVKVGTINERIAEIPFVFGAVAGLPTGARILDVGAGESTVSISLASIGFHVTAVDPRPYPLEHPNMRVHVGLIEDFVDDHPYDAAVLLSSLEHFGIGAYELPATERADRVALRRIRDLLRPGGRLVLTAPYGDAPTTELERTYRPDQIDDLLQEWDICERSYLTRRSPVEWTRTAELGNLSGTHVVLVVATKPAG